MRRILFDTNIILDVLLDRQPHAEASAALWARVEIGDAEGMVSGLALTTIHYLIRRDIGSAKANRVVAELMKVFQVAPVTAGVIQEALALPFSDFEDAVTAAAARSAGCDYVVTRDTKGFRGSPLPCFAPDAMAPLLGQS